MLRANGHQLLRLYEVNFDLVPILQVHELCDNFCHRYISCLKGKMPIDLVIDEREGGSVPKTEGLPGDSNNNANRSNADSTSHTDGASTPEVVSSIFSLKTLRRLEPRCADWEGKNLTTVPPCMNWIKCDLLKAGTLLEKREYYYSLAFPYSILIVTTFKAHVWVTQAVGKSGLKTYAS